MALVRKPLHCNTKARGQMCSPSKYMLFNNNQIAFYKTLPWLIEISGDNEQSFWVSAKNGLKIMYGMY